MEEVRDCGKAQAGVAAGGVMVVVSVIEMLCWCT